MTFACVYDLQARTAPRREQFFVRLDRAAQLRNIVAEHLAETSRLEKIALHVDDQQRSVRRIEFKGIRISIHAHGTARVHPISLPVDKLDMPLFMNGRPLAFRVPLFPTPPASACLSET